MCPHIGGPAYFGVEPQLRANFGESLRFLVLEEQRDDQVLGWPYSTPASDHHSPTQGAQAKLWVFLRGKQMLHPSTVPASLHAGRPISCCRTEKFLGLTVFSPYPLCIFALLQVRNLSNVNLKAVTDGLPTAATARSTCMCTHRISPISAKCATSPTRTRAPCANT